MGPFLFFHLFLLAPTAAKSSTVPGNITCSIIPDTVNTRLITVNWRLRNPAAFNGQLIGGGALWKLKWIWPLSSWGLFFHYSTNCH
ncbi:hypothetical protein M752DRAFT_7087 [Aspergillus phoenicis ATCC 13157]|uniref:Uncharacterized protein n=1 Tax=Aspergillus phoenicis ATCC 13157 TaxID=1353007 RepID=A0A370Q0A7_ASPPH|nr:hypothetical protein M752DRAFT_7087 [Aspergillus phoenicis ATCC 13157]